MENLDIIILTSVVSTLFIVFGILMYREFSNVEKNGWQYDPNAKKYGRDALFEIMARLFEDEVPKKARTKISKKDKEIIQNLVIGMNRLESEVMTNIIKKMFN